MADLIFADLSVKSQKKLFKKTLLTRFNDFPTYETNFYRYLSHDGCKLRHHILEPQTLEKFCPLDNDRLQESEISDQSLGLFALLPLEILVAIFVDDVDLGTLTKVRSVSQGMRRMVSKLPQYNTIATYAPASLRASLALETAQWTSCRVLYETLCSPTCSCGAFGAFLYLPTYQRVCYHCFTTNMMFLPLTPSLARAKFAVTSRNLANVPTVRSLHGNYRLSKSFGNWDRKRVRLIDFCAVGQVALTVHGTPENIYVKNRQAYNDRIREWASRTQEWNDTPDDDRAANEPRRPPHTPSFDSGEYNSHRRMLIVGFPWYNRPTDKVEWGVACNGCKRKYVVPPVEGEKEPKGPALCKVLYSKQDFLDHLTDCQEAVQLCVKLKNDIFVEEERVLPSSEGQPCHVAGDMNSFEVSQFRGRSLPSGCFHWYGKEEFVQEGMTIR